MWFVSMDDKEHRIFKHAAIIKEVGPRYDGNKHDIGALIWNQKNTDVTAICNKCCWLHLGLAIMFLGPAPWTMGCNVDTDRLLEMSRLSCFAMFCVGYIHTCTSCIAFCVMWPCHTCLSTHRWFEANYQLIDCEKATQAAMQETNSKKTELRYIAWSAKRSAQWQC